MKDRMLAVLIAFFAGGFGLHQFYLGNKSKGIWYLIFFWTLIPSFIAFIDMLILLFMTNREFNFRYNREYIEYGDPQYSSMMHDTTDQRQYMDRHFNSGHDDTDFYREPPFKEREFEQEMDIPEDALDLRPLEDGLDLDKLERLGKLRELGVLTEEEFQLQKEKLLNR